MNYKKLAALGASLAVAGGMIVSASGATGAYFSQTKAGNITGTIGTVAVDTTGGNGGNGLDFQWTNMAPGVPNPATVNYKNTGSLAADIYLQFPNDTALSAINDLGTYGAVSISTPGRGTFWSSTNLRDGLTSHCGGVYADTSASPSIIPPGCWPLRNEVLIASNVAPGASSSFTFSFTYASKLSGSGGGVFNTYPAVDGSGNPSTSRTVNADDGAAGHQGNGLPYQVVAQQVGAPALVPTN